jgi:1,4-alpha-glucan branching enzyme
MVWLFAVLGRPAAPTEGTTPVQFVLHAPGARSVTLVGDFNDWDRSAVSLTETGDGLWSVVVPLPPGTVRYAFLVDGHQWRADPAAARAPGDFGRPSSLVFIRDPGAEP